MTSGPRNNRYPVWALCIALSFLAIWLLGLLPPILEHFSHDGTARYIRSAYRLLCHGIPDRCPVIFGRPAAVCVRCSGIYFSIVLGCAVFFPLFRKRLKWKTVLLASLFVTFIMGLQWVLEFSGVIDTSRSLLTVTGFMWGTGMSLLLCKSIDMLRGRYTIS